MTRTIRASGLAVFLPTVILLVGAYIVYQGTDPLSKAKMYTALALGLFAFVGVVIHADARTRRNELEDELEILYSLSMFQPESPYPMYQERVPGETWDRAPA